jgi:uncharacterized CHY-type Zn-finger protein
MNNKNESNGHGKQAPPPASQSKLLTNFPNYVVGYECPHFPEHYCLIPNICCDKIYPCHYCHDKEEDHVYEKIKEPKYYCTKCDSWNDMTGVEYGLYIDCLDCKYCGAWLLSG